jgi:plasmid stabilization system protein ParE
MYNVEVSPAAEEVLHKYVVLCMEDQGEACAMHLLDSYDRNIALLETQPLIGCGRLRYVPDKYKVFPCWKHLWFVFQIYESEKIVKIEYIIDDRQNYGSFI